MFFWDQHKTITSCYELFTRKVCDRYQLTQMEYDILMFLHNNPKHNTAEVTQSGIWDIPIMY